MLNKYRPCPFCRAVGDETRLMTLWDTFDDGLIAHVHCSNCGADGPSVYIESKVEDALEAAYRAWNKRAQ